MHIPENYLSPSTCTVLLSASLPFLYHAVKKVEKELTVDKWPMLGVGAALSFLFMMLNIPVPGGTTAHAVGGTLLAILLGPWAAILAMTTTLIIQAVLFGDGGILAIGANILNMAVALPIIGYFTFQALKRWMPGYIAAGIAGYVGINVAAFLTAVEFGIQPMLFHDAQGLALYSPYPLSIAIPAMMIPHLTIAGLAEGLVTAIVYKLVYGGDMVGMRQKMAYGLMAFLIVVCPLGLLAEGDAWGEWATEDIAQIAETGTPLGYTPAGMLHGFSWESPIPDYAFPGLPDATGYIASALIGVALCMITFKIFKSFQVKH